MGHVRLPVSLNRASLFQYKCRRLSQATWFSFGVIELSCSIPAHFRFLVVAALRVGLGSRRSSLPYHIEKIFRSRMSGKLCMVEGRDIGRWVSCGIVRTNSRTEPTWYMNIYSQDKSPSFVQHQQTNPIDVHSDTTIAWQVNVERPSSHNSPSN